MEVNIADLTWDQFIYPKGGKSEKTPNAYVEALAIGAQFPQQIAEKAGVNQQRVSQIVGNTNFSKINTLLSQGRNMDYIEKH